MVGSLSVRLVLAVGNGGPTAVRDRRAFVAVSAGASTVNADQWRLEMIEHFLTVSATHGLADDGWSCVGCAAEYDKMPAPWPCRRRVLADRIAVLIQKRRSIGARQPSSWDTE